MALTSCGVPGRRSPRRSRISELAAVRCRFPSLRLMFSIYEANMKAPAEVTRAVREATNSREVYLLVTAYLEGVRLARELIEPFLGIATAPLASMEDVKERTLQFLFMLQAASRSLDDNSRIAVKEALYVLGAVLARLKSLEETIELGPLHCA